MFDYTAKNVVYALHLGDGRYRYVGFTRETAARRMQRHRRGAASKSQLPVNRWMRKHGVENICMDVLEVSTREDVPTREIYWIAEMRRQGYDLLNLNEGGLGGNTGYRHTVETRKMLSDMHKGRTITPEHRAKLSAALKGRPGRPMTESNRQAIIRANTGKNVSAETREKLRESGKRNSELAAESLRKTGHKRWHVNRGIVKDGCVYCA